MVSSATSILLKEKWNLHETAGLQQSGPIVTAKSSTARTRCRTHEPFLRIPPFPGAKLRDFAKKPTAPVDAGTVAAALSELRVGGSYWGAQPELQAGHVLVRSQAAAELVKEHMPGRSFVVWDPVAKPGDHVVTGECDPWHMLCGASALVAQADDELCLIAALLSVPCYEFDPDRRTVETVAIDVPHMIDELSGASYENPFTGETMDALAAIQLCGFWRRLIDANRGISGGTGFAFWKQSHVAPLLWGGSSPLRFQRNADGVAAGDCIALWRSKVPPAVLTELERRNVALLEVEDGFLRSRGLGADCIPPLSITVDRLGVHFDPTRPSELEWLLQDGTFDQAILDRARELRRLIVEAGMGKYESGMTVLKRRGERLQILVPGQVEDDRAVIAGGCGLVSNLDLLSRVREQAPDAHILYKPHPDVLAGHRRGVLGDRECLEFADEIVGELSIASLIDLADEVHVNTSLAGFEALLRGKQVTTHGVPFYAGWGLTRDLGPVPERRTAKRTIDELVAATLLLYPRYLDPVTGLPCPAEVVVARLSVIEERDPGFIVGMRRLQGKFMRRLRSLVQ